MSQKINEQQIIDLHAVFVRLTGNTVALTESRKGFWFHWLQHGQAAQDGGWGELQLRAVVDYLRRQIGKQERQTASLLFRNLIQRPEDFEEELLLARQAYRRSQPRRGASESQTVRVPTTDGVVERRLEGAEKFAASPEDVPPAGPEIAKALRRFRESGMTISNPAASTATPATNNE